MVTAKKKTSKNPLRRINFRSCKTQALTTILVFAVIGGGIFIYTSFAAVANWTFNLANGGMTYGAIGCNGASVGHDSSKSGAATVVLYCKKGVAGVTEASVTKANLGPGATGQLIRLCAWIQGTGDVTLSYIPTNTNNLSYTGTLRNFSQKNYVYTCGSTRELTYGGTVSGSVSVSKPTQDTYISVASIVIEQTAAPVLISTPTPTK